MNLSNTYNRERLVFMKKIKSGKTREIYDLGEELLIVFLDKISTLDFVFTEIIPQKGIISNKLTEFWYKKTESIIPNYMISTKDVDMPKEFRQERYIGRCMVVKKNITVIPVGGCVRGYATGYVWDARNNGSIFGLEIPKGMEESEKFPSPIYTGTTRNTAYHDKRISFEQTVERVGLQLANQIRSKSLELYAFCSEYALKKGVIIADTKFKFGIDSNNKLVLIDQVITPDTSRFWLKENYITGKPQVCSYDKQELLEELKRIGWRPHSPMPKLTQKEIKDVSAKYNKIYELLIK